MNPISRLFLAAAVGLVFAGGAAAAGVAAAASAPMDGASMPHDCAAKHDHWAEKGMPKPKSMDCAMGSESAASASPKKAKPAHDHPKFHKNQG